MRDSMTRANAADFRQRYNNTYGFFLNKGERNLVYLEHINNSEVTFTDVNGGKYCAYIDSGVEFEFIPVDHGFYNTVKGVRYMYRVPARQWHRGISDHNTALRSMSAHGPIDVLELDLQALHEIFVKGMDIGEAHSKWLEKESKQVALTKHFAVAGNGVWFYGSKVGEFNDEDFSIKLTNPIVAQELQDCLNRHGLEVKVNV